MNTITYTPIGIIHSPYMEEKGTPIQGKYAPEDVRAEIEIFEEFAAGLKDVEGFSHLYILFHFHKSNYFNLIQKSYIEKDVERGIFAVRSPYRPNAIGLSIVRLIEQKDNILIIGDVDMLDGTPVLDIKPYIPDFETDDEIRTGWVGDKFKNKNPDDLIAG